MKYIVVYMPKKYFLSPPPQGAWIEIEKADSDIYGCRRRPLHRGRGLKSVDMRWNVEQLSSPPPQGAWIEIYGGRGITICDEVAPSTGGVD